MADGRRSFDAKLDPGLAVALQDWNDKMFEMWNAYRSIGTAVLPLREAKMNICSGKAQEIADDIRAQITSGDLFARMIRLHTKRHKQALSGDMAAEIMRQYAALCVQYYFWSTDEGERPALEAQMDEYQSAIQAGMPVDDDCGCEEEEQ